MMALKKKIILFLSFIFCIHSYTYSQSGCKMNFGAALAAEDNQNQEGSVSLLVKGNPDMIQSLVLGFGGEYRFAAGDIVSVSLKLKYIRQLASSPYVSRVEAKNPFSKLQPLHDSMLVNDRVLPVHAGMAPLAQAYTGKGVVIGIIDTGIDFTHPDFKDSTGKTRIKFLWDQTQTSASSPPPYNYGSEYTASDIDNNLANAHLTTAAGYGGHGTHVASEAAGNGLAINKYKGVAPEADIIFVAANFGMASVTDAVNYIYNKAASMGKPCVINISLGDYYGSHDGKDLQSQAIKNLITAQNGRSLVAAAGNKGNEALHLGYTVSNTDTNFTWFANGAYIAMYADTNDFKNVKVAIGADKPGPNYSFRGRTSFSNITPHIGVLLYDTIWNGNKRICTLSSYGDLSNGVYSLEFQINPDSAYRWRLMTTGSGRFDEWSSNVLFANLADTSLFPALKKYKQPDYYSNIVTSFQCLDEVITVGSYVNRNQFIDYDLVLIKDTNLIPGSLSDFSSHGPTRDGRVKPDITTPGSWVIGSLVTSLFGSFSHTILAQGGYHFISNGTSFASPNLAGVAALYFQLDPSAGWQEVKNAITNCARIDNFTTANIPNNLWGYGKADAFALMTGCATFVDINHTADSETLMIYPNPFNLEATMEVFLKEKTNNALLTIYDIVGEKVRSVPINNAGKISIKRSGLSSGIYFCTLSDGGKIIAAKKLVITD
jgi:subtilisin family serine protease